MAGTGKIVSLIKSIGATKKDISQEIQTQLPGEVSDWLDEHITNPDSPPLDRSLSSSSSAAPADMVGDLKSAISDSNGKIIPSEALFNGTYIVSDNLLDFGLDKADWKKGYPGGTQGYAITLDKKITATAGQILYGAMKSLGVGTKVYMKVYAYTSGDVEIENKNIAEDTGTIYPYTLPTNTAYVYISLTTQSSSYPITVNTFANKNDSVYCGFTAISHASNIYPKYMSANYNLGKFEHTVEQFESGCNPLFGNQISELIKKADNGNLFGMYSKSYVATKTTENWQTASYIEFPFTAVENDVVHMGCFSRDGLGTSLSKLFFYDSNDDVILERSISTLNAVTDDNGGYISLPYLAPAGTASCKALFYGIANAQSAGQASVINHEYYIKNAFVYVGEIYVTHEKHLLAEWLNNVETISTAIGSKFAFGVESDTHYYIGMDDNVGYDLNEYSRLVGMDFITNLGDLILGYDGQTLDAPERTRKSMTDIVKRYTDGIACPMLFAIGNHDSNVIHHNTYGSDEFTNAELYGRIIKHGLRTCTSAKYTPGLMYYYVDFPLVRVVVLNTGDSASVASFKIGADQLAWFTSEALYTDKAVLVLSHVPLVNQFSTNYDSSYASIVSALQTFKGNGGTVIACISGHTHAQGTATVDGILYIVCTRSTANTGTAEIFMVDLVNKTITTKGFGDAEDRSFSYN